ncbi:hypothetical protein A8C56_20170 [Niabella ginsenosidivorans]|uniref:DUF4149 domain-containing protein n=1 Tax=Niabella ginsenosidivorans TaxID=1176587 RepID=A0A1A9I8U3_9BACT|nr:hypothetical protein A8C56_20170 [Niabella ginsenosidivorans]
MLNGILLICLGILAVPSLLLSRKPEAKELLDKITPYQGWIGIMFCIIGIIRVIRCILSLDLLGFFPVYWCLWLATGLVAAALGFLLGYGFIQQYVLSENKKAAEKGAQLLDRLRPRQGRLGIAAIIIGVLYIISAITGPVPVL